MILGKDYRKLKVGEIIHHGDQFWGLYGKEWIPAHESVGSGVAPGSTWRRRRVGAAPLPGSLPPGTVIQRGDEYLDSDGTWKFTNNPGDQVVDGTYRRLRAPIDPPQEKPLPACSGVVEAELWKLEKKLRRKAKLQDITHAECYLTAAKEVRKTMVALSGYVRL